MAIGNMWQTADKRKIWALFDPDEDLHIPIGIDQRLQALGVGYASHQVLVSSPLECPDPGTYTQGQRIRPRIKRIAAAAFSTTAYYPVLLRIFGDDGTTKSDLTLYLKFRDGSSDNSAEA